MGTRGGAVGVSSSWNTTHSWFKHHHHRLVKATADQLNAALCVPSLFFII